MTIVTIASVALAVVMLVIAQFVPPPPGMRPDGIALPRMAPAPVTTGDLLRMLGVGSLVWYACFVSFPLFLLLSRYLSRIRASWPTGVTLNVILVLALTLLTTWLQYHLSYRGSPLAPPLDAWLRVGVLTGTLPFLTVAAIAYAVDAFVQARERDMEAARIRSELAETRLETLTAQLQPHFLFNTLQGISTLIFRDPVAADRMLTSLSDLLREVLDKRNERVVELREELRVLDAYLDISRRRHGSRLALSVSASDEISRAQVPFFIFQPIVENAMRHGVGSHGGQSHVQVSAQREGTRLILKVEDDGPGVATSDTQRGIGLANTRERLQQLYADNHGISAGRREEGGFVVMIDLPYNELHVTGQQPAKRDNCT